MRKFAIIMVLMSPVFFVHCFGGKDRAPRALERPHIILILIDTLRADRLSSYGYGKKTTPEADKLAALGTLFEKAYAPSSWTLPSVATVFTGLFPQDHGVVQGLLMNRRVLRQHQLNFLHRTLAERLLDAGYETFGYSANAHITRAMGFAQGFNIFREAQFTNAEVLETLLAADLDVLKAVDRRGKPYFLYLHLVDPHWPYQVREPWFSRLHPAPDREALDAARGMVGDPMLHYPAGYFRENPRLRDALSDIYDSEVAAADAAIGRMLNMVPRSDQAFIMLISDHGEAFSEHDTMLHGYDLFEETVRVPFIIRGPRSAASPAREGRRVTRRVSLLDVAPTLLAVAGTRAEDLPGQDLNGEIEARRPFLFHLSRGPIRAHGALVGQNKGIVDDRLGRTMFFDLERDPEEKKDLLPDTSMPEELVRAMGRAALIAPKIEARMISNEKLADRERLKSLGYLTEGYETTTTITIPTATPAPTPETEKISWVIGMNICLELFAIEKTCGEFAGAKGEECRKSRLADLKKKACPRAPSFDIRKKCEFMRLPSTLRRCEKSSR